MFLRWQQLAVCVSLVGLWSSVAFAQDSELQAWSKGEVEADVKQGLAISVAQHLRMFTDTATIQSALSELAFKQRILPWLAVGGGYRLEFVRQPGDAFQTRHRMQLGLSWKRKMQRISLDLRARVQARFQDEKDTRWKTRSRLRIRYLTDSKMKLRPSLAGEFFYGLGDGKNSGSQKLRLTSSLGAKWTDWAFEPFYRLEIPLKDGDETLHILGLNFQWGLKL